MAAQEIAGTPVVALGENRRFTWRRTLSQHPSMVFGLVILGVLITVAIIGPIIIQTDPLNTNPTSSRQAPSAEFIFGTDESGRDIFSRVIYAIGLNLMLATIIAFNATIIGVSLAIVAGYLGGGIDQFVMRIVDVLMAFPGFLLAVGLTVLLGNNVRTVILALSVAYAPVAIRVVRAQVLALRNSQFIQASQAIGTPAWEIMLYHILPHTTSILLAQTTLFLAWSVLDIAGLSFIGLGIQPPTPELGAMAAQGAEQMVSGRWWMSVFPGATILLMALSFTLIGDGLRDILDPRQSR